MLYIAIVAHTDRHRAKYENVLIRETQEELNTAIEADKAKSSYVIHWTGELHNFRMHLPNETKALPNSVN